MLALERGERTIGRQADCDITVRERSVSRVHAVLRFEAGLWQVDHRSRTNPTLLNGEPVTHPVALYDGDELTIADAVGFRVEAPAARRPDGVPKGLRAAMEQRVELGETP